jgi:hypothetical protein
VSASLGPVSLVATDVVDESVFWKKHPNVNKDFRVDAEPKENPPTSGPFKDSTMIMNVDFDFT